MWECQQNWEESFVDNWNCFATSHLCLHLLFSEDDVGCHLMLFRRIQIDIKLDATNNLPLIKIYLFFFLTKSWALGAKCMRLLQCTTLDKVLRNWKFLSDKRSSRRHWRQFEQTNLLKTFLFLLFVLFLLHCSACNVKREAFIKVG